MKLCIEISRPNARQGLFDPFQQTVLSCIRLLQGPPRHTDPSGLFSVVTVFDAVSAAILPVWVDFTSLKGLPCAPGPATTRRGMLVTNG